MFSKQGQGKNKQMFVINNVFFLMPTLRNGIAARIKLFFVVKLKTRGSNFLPNHPREFWSSTFNDQMTARQDNVISITVHQVYEY